METPVYLTSEEFGEKLLSVGAGVAADEEVLNGLPFVFRDSPATYDALKNNLGVAFGIDAVSFIVVGSGRTGFSLSPKKYGKIFGDDSDIDVSVVSENLFDALWFELIRLPRSRAANLNRQVQEFLREHRTNRIFHGRALPHQLWGATSLASRWFRAFNSVGRALPALASYDLNGMLFRTNTHARLYYMNGLRQIAWTLRGGSN